MADSRKNDRPKGRRPSKPTGASGKTGYGKDGARSSGRPGAKPTGRPARGPRKPSGNRDERPRRERAPREDARAPRQESRARVDDFDFDDLRLDDGAEGGAPAAFPKPARTAAGRPDRSERSERSDRPERAERAPRPAPARDEAEAAEEGKSVTAGKNPVRELLENFPRRVDAVYVRKGQRDARAQEIVALADANRIKVHFADDATLRRLYPGTHQGVIAVTAAVEYADLDTLIAAVADAPLPVLLALDKVQDPGNLGAVARTAWALGAAGIIVPRHGGAYIGAGAMRASAGALHHLPVARVTNMSQALDACAEAGLPILCADASGEDIYAATIRLPAVLVLGGEEKGVRFGVAKHCQQKLAIPFRREFDSLNVAQAAAICLARLGLK